jgi:hypothetical protein
MKIIIMMMVSIFFLCGCASKRNVTAIQPKVFTKSLPQTKYDVFNLKWGMNKDECYRICDWGNKLEEVNKYNFLGTHLIRFEKGLLNVSLKFNDSNQLYGAYFLQIYKDTDFCYAKDFYISLSSILRKKYHVNYDSFKGAYLAHPSSVVYERFLNGEISFISVYESRTTKISLGLIPWTVPGSKENRAVLAVDYRSKNIRGASFSKEIKVNKDAYGL